MLNTDFPSLSKLTLALAAAASLAAGCASVPTSDPATVAAAAVAAAGAARAATENASPIATPPDHAAADAVGTKPAVAAAAAAAAAAAVAAQQKPFADVVKDAKEHPGFFNVYAKDEKVWLEIRPDQIDRPFFLQANRTHGIGERDPFISPMLRSYIVEFHRLGNLVQLIAKNTQFLAAEGSPIARAVRESTSDSLLGAVPLASQPHPERKSVLIELNALLLTDLPAGSTALEAAYRISYAFDARNSSFTAIHNSADLTGVEVSAHYAVSKLPPPPTSATATRTAPPAHLEDARSLFLGYYYSLAKLPEAMHARAADDRLGHFLTRRWDFSDDIKTFPEVYYVKRWRLEKKDPDAAMSEPKKPIVYWLDRNIPEKYRETVKAGILEWNKAFEKIGFKDALRVEVQPENADFDTADAHHASVHWVVRDEPGALAIGPSRADPRTGEILDADIEIEDGWTRLPRRQASEQFRPRAQQPRIGGEDAYCEYGDVAMDELAFALDVLVARGEIDPEGPEAQKYVLATLKDVVTHEVGHTLGLQHNFRASTIYSQKQLADPAFTQTHGIGGSVMDYNAINLALQSESQGDYVMSTIGPYDYWAIEYAYKPIAPENEKTELAKIAARSDEPQLAFANDVDAGFGGAAEGMDPQVNRRDLGNDPLEFATRRLKLSRELWERLQDRKLAPGQSYEVLRRNFLAGLTQLGNSGAVAAKFVGGVVYVRDHAGSRREPFTPVAPEKQRAALKLIADGLLSVDSFRLRPEFVRRLTVDQFDRVRGDAGPSAISPDISLSDRMLGVQRSLLDQLLSDAVATRIEESAYRQARSGDAFHLSDLYDTLEAAVWSELKSGRDITPFRRNLQREYLRRIATTMLRPTQSTHADARALQRADATQLLAQIRSAKTRTSFSKEARAHLAECENTLEEALKAPMLRPGA